MEVCEVEYQTKPLLLFKMGAFIKLKKDLSGNNFFKKIPGDSYLLKI